MFRGALIAIPCAGLALLGACTSLTSEVQTSSCTQVGGIVVGDTLRDSITASSCHQIDHTYANRYRFQLIAQTKLLVSLSSPRQKAFLFVSDSAGVLIANSSITSPLDTAATLHLILKAGAYALGVSSVAAAPSGPLRLVASDDPSAVSGCVPIWVTTGITTTQTISGTDCTTGPLGSSYFSHTYLTVILGGHGLTLTEHATGFTPEVLVSGQSGATLGTSTVDATGTNALLDYSPAADAALLLWVGSSDQRAFGQYTLTIN
jgi:hypothetical protein